ncbi:hypothetical protein [uncultured Ottowia sp.]|uniref:hypothetical protein n=1 Tax=uncultured Ottowia sp. TaxID=543067 RepID=UPI002593A8B5|nr:hypothetical protein [uncultured Ottowia sp.]
MLVPVTVTSGRFGTFSLSFSRVRCACCAAAWPNKRKMPQARAEKRQKGEWRERIRNPPMKKRPHETQGPDAVFIVDGRSAGSFFDAIVKNCLAAGLINIKPMGPRERQHESGG